MKKIMIIGGGMFSIPLIKKAKELGAYVICIHHENNTMGFAYADSNHVCDASDLNKLLKIAQMEQIDGVATISEYAALPAAEVAAKLNLPGYKPEAVKVISNKYALRRTLRDLGIPQPSFGLASTELEARRVFEKLEKPVMVKPVNSCGSRGVFKADRFEEVKKGLEATVAENFASDRVIIEEFMEGQELGGGVMFKDKEIFVPSITSKYVDQNYIPIANILPGAIKGKHLSDLTVMLEKIARHFNIGDNYLNVNLILTKDGPRILELGARLAGNSSPEITSLCYGVDPYEYVLNYSLSLKRNFNLSMTGQYAAIILGSKAAGNLLKIHSFNELFPELRHMLVKEFWRCKPGDLVHQMNKTDFILGFLIVRGDGKEDMTSLAMRLQSANWLEVRSA